MGHGFGMGFGIPGLGMLIFWGVLILLLVWLLRAALGSNSKRMSTSAREILEQRYARGEIDRDEYAEKKRSLE